MLRLVSIAAAQDPACGALSIRHYGFLDNNLIADHDQQPLALFDGTTA